jgi:hypothetical protein
VQKGSQERPVSWSELGPCSAEVPLQHFDLVPEGEDLEVFVAIAHG